MTLDTLEHRALAAGFATCLHANALYIGADDDGTIAWETVRYFTTPGSGGRSHLAFLDADNVPASMLSLLD
jgi:hypothetical protein